MNAEIIAIGSELLLGQIIDTNTSSIARRLAENGISVVRTTAVGDDFDRMKEVIKEGISRSQIIITTGGIGPTEDDLTREAVAEVFNRPLVFQPPLMEQIEAIFKRRGFQMTQNNRKQAFIPEGAIPVENPKGTAPGFMLEYQNGIIISIPGVPSEMEYLMDNTVIPFIRDKFKIAGQVILFKVLRACGLGESAIGDQIKDLMKESKNPLVGTLASVGDIRIRITGEGGSPEEAAILIQRMEEEIRGRLGILIYGVNDETLHGNLVKELQRLNLSVAVVEHFTGGIISQKLSGTGGSSFVQGFVLPTSESLRRFLGQAGKEFDLLSQDLKKLTGILASTVRTDLKTGLGLAVVGKVMEDQGRGEYRTETHYSLSTPAGTEHQEYTIGGEPGVVRERVSIIALDLVRKTLLSLTKDLNALP